MTARQADLLSPTRPTPPDIADEGAHPHGNISGAHNLSAKFVQLDPAGDPVVSDLELQDHFL